MGFPDRFDIVLIVILIIIVYLMFSRWSPA